MERMVLEIPGAFKIVKHLWRGFLYENMAVLNLSIGRCIREEAIVFGRKVTHGLSALSLTLDESVVESVVLVAEGSW